MVFLRPTHRSGPRARSGASAASWLVGLLLALGGCSSPPPGPPLAPVTGLVTYKLRPVPQALVVFSPTDGQRIAMGRTDAEGRFTLTTFERHDGALIAKHRVHIVAHGPGREMTPEEKSQAITDIHYIPGPPIIPQKYFTADTSGLTADVVPEGPNDFRFDLAD